MSATITPHAAAAVRRPKRRLRFAGDAELVRLLRAGDEGAFEAMFDRHHRGILAFARHMVGSREEAEDVVQHTFIAAHRDLVGSGKPIQLKAWLYTIARNRCLSLLRARREERALDDVPEPSVEGLAAQVQRREDLRDMVADLHRLPEDQRAALVLSELGALTHEEIAETLGVRKDKVKALVFQARESLASSRTARDADCREIQEQLAVLRGGSLRRTKLRRHVEVCPACAAFKAEVQRQRNALAVILPVAPTVALKETVLGALFTGGGGAVAFIGGGGGAAGAAGGGLLSAVGSKSLAAKVMTIAAVAGGATGGGIMAVDEISSPPADGIALGAAPPEQRSVQMVGDLRERAREAAVQRDAGRAGGAAGPAFAPGDAPARRPLQVASAGTARAVAVAGSPRATRQRRERRPRSVTPAAPRERAAAPPAAAAPALPATEVGPEQDAPRENGRPDPGGPKDGRGWRKREGGKAASKKAELPKVELPAAVTDRSAQGADTPAKADRARGNGKRNGHRPAPANGKGPKGTPATPRAVKPGEPAVQGQAPGKAGKAGKGPGNGKGDPQHGDQGKGAGEKAEYAAGAARDAVAQIIGAIFR